MQSQTEVHTVQLPCGETYAYRQAGDVNNSRVLICLHGGMESSKAFTHLLPLLSDSFRIIAIDARGHGDSSYHKEVDSYDCLTQDVREFLEVLGIKKAWFIGRSVGGGVSMKLAANYPDLVEGIILHSSIGLQGFICPKADENGKDTAERASTRDECINHPHSLMLADVVAKKNSDMVKWLHEKRYYCGKAQPVPEDLEEKVDDYMTCKVVPIYVYLTNFFNISNEHNGVTQGTGEVDKIKCPVLIIHGEKSVIIKVEEAKRTKEYFGDRAELKVFPDAGHLISQDHPEEVSDLIKQFCKVSA